MRVISHNTKNKGKEHLKCLPVGPYTKINWKTDQVPYVLVALPPEVDEGDLTREYVMVEGYVSIQPCIFRGGNQVQFYVQRLVRLDVITQDEAVGQLKLDFKTSRLKFFQCHGVKGSVVLDKPAHRSLVAPISPLNE